MRHYSPHDNNNHNAKFVEANDIVLFAQNTGELYERHKDMARADASEGAWAFHVQNVVMRLYKSQFGRGHKLGLQAGLEAARELRTYYNQHIKEL